MGGRCTSRSWVPAHWLGYERWCIGLFDLILGVAQVHELILGLSVQTKRKLRSAATMLELSSLKNSTGRSGGWMPPTPSSGLGY